MHAHLSIAVKTYVLMLFHEFHNILSDMITLTVAGDDYIAVYNESGEVVVETTSYDEEAVVVFENPCVLAVYSNNSYLDGSILGYTVPNHVVTDASWKCSDVYEDYWYHFMFNDSHWENAVVVPRHVLWLYMYLSSTVPCMFWCCQSLIYFRTKTV